MAGGDEARLLGYAEVAELTGFKAATIRNYLSASRRAVKARGYRTETDFPAPHSRVWREYVKGNGEAGAGFTPVWAEADIVAYLEARGLEPMAAVA